MVSFANLPQSIDGGASMIEPKGGFLHPNLKAVFEAKRPEPVPVPTANPPAPSEAAHDEEDSTPVGAIAGGVVAGVAILAIVTGLAIFFLRRKRKQAATQLADGEAPPPAYEKRGELHEMSDQGGVMAELPVNSAHEMPAIVPVYELPDESSNSVKSLRADSDVVQHQR